VNLLFESQDGSHEVTLLTYPDMAELERETQVVEGSAPADGDVRVENAVTLERLAQLATEAQLEEAREQGREGAFAECVKRLREGLDIERSAVTHLCTSFTQERKRYFAEIEAEVVKLALAVAARILNRESAMDPTLLEGVVRVALAKLGEPAGAVLRMNIEDEEVWRTAMKGTGLRVEGVVGLERGALQLEAEGGVAELGIAAQLVEVERGFFDLLARRPA
jgi:flagellar assembly protein FliH